jgi:hypothetical protein
VTRLLLVAALGVAALAGCGTRPVPSQGDPTEEPATSAAASATSSAPEPGQPFEPGDILAAMRDSRRPGGVPEEVQTDAIAAALADHLWTIDGQPWSAIAASGSCEGDTCSLELSGAPPDAAGEDVWVFTVAPASGEVAVATADLHGVPADWISSLDAMARDAPGSEMLPDLTLTAVRWQPPPAVGRFDLAYRTGDEEESCSVDLVLDAAGGIITDLEVTGC